MSFRDMVTNVPGLCRAAAAQNVQLTYAMWQIAASILHETPVRPLRHIMLLGVTRKVGTSFVARALAEFAQVWREAGVDHRGAFGTMRGR